MTDVLLMLSPLLTIGGFAVLARWERARQRARETHLRHLYSPSRADVDAAVDRHFDTLPDFVKGAPQ